MDTDERLYFDGNRHMIFHKNPLVETIASLHSLRVNKEKNLQSNWMTKGRINKPSSSLIQSIDMYGSSYADWLLIMDIGTYISCKHYRDTGEFDMSFEQAIREFRTMSDTSFIYVFFGMPALGLTIHDAEQWLKDSKHIDRDQLQLVCQYISEKNITIFLNNLRTMRIDLASVIEEYWYMVFQYIWNDIELYISKTIRSCLFDLRNTGNCTKYMSYLHSDIRITKNQLVFLKDITYSINLDEIEFIHVFPSTFSEEELLIDRIGNSLVIYFNLNLRNFSDQLLVPVDLEKVFRALGDTTRIKIVKLIWGTPASTNYLSNVMGLAASTISGHLKILLDAGLVYKMTIKQYVYYEVNREFIESLNDRFLSFVRED